MRISDWSSDVCSSDLPEGSFRQRSGAPILAVAGGYHNKNPLPHARARCGAFDIRVGKVRRGAAEWTPCPTSSSPASGAPSVSPNWSGRSTRSEEHTSELQSLMRISYAVCCLTKKKISLNTDSNDQALYLLHRC